MLFGLLPELLEEVPSFFLLALSAALFLILAFSADFAALGVVFFAALFCFTDVVGALSCDFIEAVVLLSCDFTEVVLGLVLCCFTGF